jgi:hypothetical protein
MLSTLIRAPSRLLPAKLEQAVHGHRCLCDALLLVEENWDAAVGGKAISLVTTISSPCTTTKRHMLLPNHRILTPPF